MELWQRRQLQAVLEKYSKLFDGTLGVYPHEKFHIEVDPEAQPEHLQPYAVPQIHLETFKKELKHLVKLGVLSPQGTDTIGCKKSCVLLKVLLDPGSTKTLIH